MKDSPVQARKRAENPADGLTRMLWSSSGRRRRQGFQPISSWYRRTLHCSCNSQLRSPRFNCVSAWYGLCMNSRALLLLQSNMPEASSRHQQSILRHATLQCVWHQCVRVRGKTHEVSGNVRRHVWCCSHPLSQWVDNYNREERAEKMNTPVWVNSQRLNGVTVHYRGVYGKAVAVQFTESVTFSFGVLHIHVHAHKHRTSMGWMVTMVDQEGLVHWLPCVHGLDHASTVLGHGGIAYVGPLSGCSCMLLHHHVPHSTGGGKGGVSCHWVSPAPLVGARWNEWGRVWGRRHCGGGGGWSFSSDRIGCNVGSCWG